MSHKPKHSHADYLRYLIPLESRRKSLRLAKKFLKLSELQFDAIAFCGMSGALIGPSLALALNKNLLMVRKVEDTHNHSKRKVEGDEAAERYIIVDDLVSDGNTVRMMRKRIKDFAPQAQCLGVLLINRLGYLSISDVTPAASTWRGIFYTDATDFRIVP